MKSYKIDKFSAKVFSKWKKCGKIYSVWEEKLSCNKVYKKII
jgi:hypothetical protein